MLFNYLKYNLKYNIFFLNPRFILNVNKNFPFLALLWFCLPLFFSSLANAEGSRELVAHGGYRPYLQSSTGDNAQIPKKTKIRVFVNEDEQVNLGSSVPTSVNDPNDITYSSPSGTQDGSCNVDETTGEGFIDTLEKEKAGPLPKPGGYTSSSSCQFTAEETGIYEIEFIAPETSGTPDSVLATDPFPTDNTQKGGIAAWDVTVFKTPNDATTEQTGRVYANYLPMHLAGGGSTLNSIFFILSDKGYLYRLNMNGTQPIEFVFFSNNKGFKDSGGNPLLKSVSMSDVGTTAFFQNPKDDDTTDDITYKIFLNPPARDLPADSVLPAGKKTWLFSPDLPKVTGFTFKGSDGTPGQVGTEGGGTFQFSTNKKGTYELTIDVNNNGIYGDANDRVLTDTIAAGTGHEVPWDGLDKDNNLLPAKKYQVELIVTVDEVHFPFFDVEKNEKGLILQRVTNCTSPLSCQVEDSTVYYNNENFCETIDPTDPKTCIKLKHLEKDKDKDPLPPLPDPIIATNPISALEGIDSSSGAQVFDDNFGDKRGIDTWALVTVTSELSGGINVMEADLRVSKSHKPAVPFPGGLVTYTIAVKNEGPSIVSGIKVQDIIPDEIIGATWTCDPTNFCTGESGIGDINTTIALPDNMIATFTINGIVKESVSSGQMVENTVTIIPPKDVNDPDDTNNTDKDSFTISSDSLPSEPPVIKEDFETTDSNTPVIINVLKNDQDDDGFDINTLNVIEPPEKGDFVINYANGRIEYTPIPVDSDETDTFNDTFVYKICDNTGLCGMGTVIIEISPKRPPSPPPPPPPPPPPEGPKILPKEMNLTVELSGSGHGRVQSDVGGIDCDDNNDPNCAYIYETATRVTLTPTAAHGSIFNAWGGNKDCDDGEVSMNSYKVCIAYFSLLPATLKVAYEGSGKITSKPSGIDCYSGSKQCTYSFNGGSKVELTPIPDSGWKFESWKQDCDENGHVMINSDKQCTAVFKQLPQSKLFVAKTGEGTVIAVTPPGGINCGSDCNEIYSGGITVSLEGTPDPGWTFDRWTGHCDNTGQVVIDGITSCRAVFLKSTTGVTNPTQNQTAFHLTVNKTGNGTVTSQPTGINCGVGCNEEYASGTKITLNPIADSGWEFKSWLGDCDDSGQVMMNAEKECKAVFVPIAANNSVMPFRLTVYKTGQGIVTSEPMGINCGNKCSEDYDGSGEVMLMPTPDSGWQFKDWTGHCDDTGRVMMEEPLEHKRCRAIFISTPLSTPLENGNGTVTSTEKGQVTRRPVLNCGDNCSAEEINNALVELAATPKPGFTLVGWSGDCSGNAKTITVSAAAAQNCQPQFAPDDDQDSVANSVEDGAPNQGDGNNDGILDSLQNNVISLRMPDGQYITVEESNGCTINEVQLNDSTSTPPVNLNASCPEATLTTYHHGVSDPSKLNDSGTAQGSNVPTTSKMVMIAGQPVLAETLTLSDGGLGDSIAGDGKITQIIEPNQESSSSSNTIEGEFNSSEGTSSTADSGTPSANDASSEDVTSPSVNDTNSSVNATSNNTPVSGTVSSVSNNTSSNIVSPSCQLLEETVDIQTQSLSVMMKVGETMKMTIGAGEGLLYVKEIPNSAFVSMDDWKILSNGDGELTLTGQRAGQTQMIISDRTSSQQVILNLQVIAAADPPKEDVKKQPVNKEIITLLTSLDVGQTSNLSVDGGKGELSISEMPDNTQVSLEAWQPHGDGTADFTLTGLNPGLTRLLINDSATPPQKMAVNITIIGSGLVPDPVSGTVITDISEIHCKNNVLGIDAAGRSVENRACFIGEVKSDEHLQPNHQMLTHEEAKLIRVSVTLFPDPNHVGQAADILLLGVHTTLTDEDQYARDQQTWKLWTDQINELPAAQSHSQLDDRLEISIFEGDLSTAAGEFTVFAGYRLNNGTIIHNGSDPLHFFVGNSLSFDRHNNTGESLTSNEVQATSYFEPFVYNSARVRGNNLIFKRNDSLSVSNFVRIDSRHVGLPADILMVASYQDQVEQLSSYTRNRFTWQIWDGQIENIPVAQHYHQLPTTLEIPIYMGSLTTLPGKFTIYVGYQLGNGVIVFNGFEPIQLTIANDTE